MEYLNQFSSSPETLITKEIISIISTITCSSEKKISIKRLLFNSFRNVFSGSWKISILLFVTYLVKNPKILLEILGKILKFLFYKKVYLKFSVPKENVIGSSIKSEIDRFSASENEGSEEKNGKKYGSYAIINNLPLYCQKQENEYELEYFPCFQSSYVNRITENVEKDFQTIIDSKKPVYKTYDGKSIEITNLFPSRNNKLITSIISTLFRVSSKTRSFFTFGILVRGSEEYGKEITSEGYGKTASLSWLISQGVCDHGILLEMNKNLDVSFDDILKKIFSFSPNGKYVIYIDELDKYLDSYIKNKYREACKKPKDLKKEDAFVPPEKQEFMQTEKEAFLGKLLGLIETRHFKDGVVFVFCANNFNTIFEGVNMKQFKSVYKRIKKVQFRRCDTEEFKDYCRWYNESLKGDEVLYISEEELEVHLQKVKKDLCIPLREIFFSNVEACFNFEDLVRIVNEWKEEDLSDICGGPF